MSTLTEAAEAVAKMKGIPTEEKLREILSTGVLIVTFNKLDGEERVMTCTNNIENIPEESRPKNNSAPKAQGLVTVWDMNAKGWRSFKYDRVTKVEGGGTVKVVVEERKQG